VRDARYSFAIMSLYCEECQLSFSRRFNFNRHLQRDSHQRNLLRACEDGVKYGMTSTVTTPEYKRADNRRSSERQPDARSSSKNKMTSWYAENYPQPSSKLLPQTGDGRDNITSNESDDQHFDTEDNERSEISDVVSTEGDKVYWDDDDSSDSNSGEDTNKDRDVIQQSYVCYEDYLALKKNYEKLMSKPVKKSILLRVSMKLPNRSMKTISVRWIKTDMCKDLSVAQLKRIFNRGMSGRKDLYILIECFVNLLHA